MLSKYRARFDELEGQLIKLENTRHTSSNSFLPDMEYVDDELFIEWRLKAKSLIANACGKESEHYKAFCILEKAEMIDPNYDQLIRIKAVFHAAKEDYLGGYLESVRSLIQAELFDDELGQARELLNKNYYLAAAVIAGTVLETRMRELSKENNIPVEKNDTLNKMNDNLTKNGVYNSILQKQITALAGIRNSAAHGKADEFSKEQVVDMIKQIETLLAYNFSFT